MLHPINLHDYQNENIHHGLTHDDFMLWLQMGLGKTIILLTIILERMRRNQVKKVLIFGPLRVIQSVWQTECRKWSHTRHLRCSIVHGTPEKRTRALFIKADIYLINYENMNWLAEVLDKYFISQGKPLPFEMVVYDEITKLKDSNSKRMAGGFVDRTDKKGNEYRVKLIAWRKFIDCFKYRAGLTGTPAPNGYMDLFGQFLAVDGGQRLGQYVTHYKKAYFVSDYMGWKYTPTEEGKKAIEAKISDITKRMDTRDYLDLPPVKTVNMMVDLPPKARKLYRQIEAEMFAKLEDGTEIDLFNQASVSNKCLQFCLAEGTEILTDKGWKPIETFRENDKVWDGEEWVNVHSLALQGYREVIELDGVWMTKDHKVLTKSGWIEAGELTDETSNRFDRVEVRLPNGYQAPRFHEREEKKSYLARAMRLWKKTCKNRSKPEKSKPREFQFLRLQTWSSYFSENKQSWYDKNKTVRVMEEHEIQMPEPERQRLPELRWQRNRCVRSMVQLFRRFLGGYGRHVSRPPFYRAIGQQWSLLQRELPVGYPHETVQQQKNQYVHRHTFRENDSFSGCEKIQHQTSDTVCENTQRMGRKRSVTPCRITQTYDLINSGERNRFTVRGSTGKAFIVHNCNGSPYIDEDLNYTALHNAKLDALGEVLEEASGQPVLCSYSFKADAERIMKKFKKYRPVNLTATPSSQTASVIQRWQDGKIPLMIGHAASMGHGIDGLQENGSILVWFGLTWSLELHDQMNGRLDRQGQKNSVSIIRILCNDTVDLAVADAIERKTDDQEGLKNALNRYKAGLTTNELEWNFY